MSKAAEVSGGVPVCMATPLLAAALVAAALSEAERAALWVKASSLHDSCICVPVAERARCGEFPWVLEGPMGVGAGRHRPPPIIFGLILYNRDGSGDGLGFSLS